MSRNLYAAITLFILFVLACANDVVAQSNEVAVPPPVREKIRATPAYAEIVLRRAELESTLEELLTAYKEDFGKVKSVRYELGLINAEFIQFGRLKDSDAPKLTLALGKLIVRRAELATNYWLISNRYSDEHPTAKKAKRKFEIFDRAVRDIL